MFEVKFVKRRPMKWEWEVCSLGGATAIMSGWEKTRQAAKYRGYRAMFLLLAATGHKTNDPPQALSGPRKPVR